jgi:hypothetical protein
MAKAAYREIRDRRQKLDKTPIKIAVEQGNRSSSSRNIRPIKTLGLMCVGWPSLPRQRFPNRFPAEKVVVPKPRHGSTSERRVVHRTPVRAWVEPLCQGLAKGLGWPRYRSHEPARRT